MAAVPKTPLDRPSAGTIPGSLSTRSEALPQNAFGQDTAITLGNIGVATGNIREVQLGIEKDYANSLAAAGREAAAGGQALMQAGANLSQQVAADKALQNETTALNTSTSYAQSTNQLQSAYLNLQGTNATDGYTTFEQQVRERETAALEGITDPQARRMAQARIQGQTTQVLAAADRWRQQQGRVANVTARESAATQQINEGIVQRFNPSAMNAALETGLSEVHALGEVAGWDSTTLGVQQARYRGRFYTGVIASLAESGTDAGVTAAASLFGQVRNTMDAESAVRVENALSGPVRRADANGRAVSATSGSAMPPPVAAPETPADMQATARRMSSTLPNVTVTGTDRTPERNAEVGGARDSQHLHGRAIDFRLSGTDEEKAASLQRILRGDFGPVGGVGTYNDGSLHIDFRPGARAAWGPDRTQASLGQTPAWFQQAVSSWRASPDGTPRASRQDRGQVLAAATAGTEHDPQLRAETIAQTNSILNVQEAGFSQERTAMTTRITAINTTLAAGGTATVPEQDIRRLWPPAEADRMLDQIRTNEIAGQLFTSTALATPQQVADVQQDLQTGNGPITAALRQARGIQVLNGGVSEEDKPVDAAARTALQQVVNQRLAARQQSLTTDPMLYAQIDPTVRDLTRAMEAAGANATPDMRAGLITAGRAAQARLGVLETNQRALTKAQSETIASRLLTGDPATTDVAGQMRGLASSYGSAWPLVLNDLVRDGHLPREFETLAVIPSAVGQTDFQRMLVTRHQAGGQEEFTRRLGNRRSLVEQATETAMQNFVGTATASGATGGRQLADTVTSSVRNLAYYYALGGQDPETAARNAVDRVVNDRYDISGTIRVPKGMLNAVGRAQTQVLSGLTASQLAVRPGNPELLPDESRAVDFTAAQRGFWVTNQRDNGLVLMMQIENGGRVPVRLDPNPPEGRARTAEELQTLPMVTLQFNNLPQPVIPGASEPQRDSPARAVQRIPGFDTPQPGERRPPAATTGPSDLVPPADRPRRQSTGRWQRTAPVE